MTYKLYITKPAFIHEVRLNSSSSFTSGSTVPLNALTSSHNTGNVSLSSNVVTLQPGDYMIHGSVAIDRTDTADAYSVMFYDNATSTPLAVSDGWFFANTSAAGDPTSTTFTSGSITLLAQVELSSAVSFYLRSDGASGTLVADGSQLIIMEL